MAGALQEKGGAVTPRRTLVIAAVVFAIHLAGSYLLDACGLVEGLLSPHGRSIALLLPLAVAFYAARLALFFLVPGLLMGALALWALERAAARRRRGLPARI